jgi:hypothetical protein
MPTAQRVEALCNALSTTHKPKDEITVFMSAFRLASRCLKTDILGSTSLSSIPPSHISVSVLLFTDGKDTSIWFVSFYYYLYMLFFTCTA